MIEQIAIGLCGCLSIYLSQSSEWKVRRWACAVGLLAQPFWFYMTWEAHQYGVFALCFLYTFSWLRGVWTHWICDEPEKRKETYL